MQKLVSTDWLANALSADDLAILDASNHLPSARRDARSEYLAAHIPGARYLDLASLKDENAPIAAAIPTADKFAHRMQELGVKAGDRIVLYDDSTLRTAARAYFIFRLFGFRQIAILNGGLGKWKAEGRPLEDGYSEVSASFYATPIKDEKRVRDKADMLANCEMHTEQVIDARDDGRFSGAVEDTVHGLPGGHIPGSHNLHFAKLLAEDGTYKQTSELRALFEQAGVKLDVPVVASCGSGMTASVLLFALELIGQTDTALYDGSWSEWGADPDTPKETGSAQ